MVHDRLREDLLNLVISLDQGRAVPSKTAANIVREAMSGLDEMAEAVRAAQLVKARAESDLEEAMCELRHLRGEEE